MNMILKDLKLKIKKDEKVVIFGKNGCGKTTLMSILLRLEKPDDGKIVVNGYDIEMIGLEYYRKCIAAVLTDFYLINDSIINIIIDKDMEADEKKVKKIVDVCGLTDLITQRGYAYNVGENGEKLSAGQKQKICLARALISNRDLLFLDEATSNLDFESKRKVIEYLKEIDKGIVMITHDIDVIKNFNYIIYLKDGKVDDKGTGNIDILVNALRWCLGKNLI